MAWIRAIDRAETGDSVAAHAITAYQDAARAYHRVSIKKADLRARAHVGW